MYNLVEELKAIAKTLEKKNYFVIVQVGDLLDPSFFLDNREAEAYYLAARKYCHQ